MDLISEPDVESKTAICPISPVPEEFATKTWEPSAETLIPHGDPVVNGIWRLTESVL